ncbi:MAG: UvrD-helicase domain-containing protein, partial [Bdellovibrionales bacterium]|nr:UvrD-helicase domain-containing protein [Bdellovibrionales bacterium]
MSGPSLDLSFSNKDHIVRAGAGAGKTYNLVACVYEAYLHFKSLEGGKNPRFILTTFTRKATQELRERMVLKACEVQDEEFFNFVTDSNFLSISTIHGVLGQFLKEFGHLFQMDLSFNILEGEDENNLLESVARELVLEEEGSFRWLDEFGMYKLSGMLRSFHFHFGKNPNLRAPTFEEAFEHTEDYVFRRKQELLDLVDEGLRVVTDEPYLKSLLSIKEFLEAWEIGVELELPALARKAKRETFPLGLHEVLMPKISQFKKQLKEIVTDSDELRKLTQQWEEFFQFATKFSDKVKEKKREKGAVTLSDLENQVADILRQSPFLGKIFSDNFDYWLIDEFQDTSSHQLDILNQLIGDRPRFVVGDPQQSIYLFRGAEAQIFSQEWGRVGRESGRTSKLELNYRSQRELLYFFNEVMGQCPQFSPMEAHHDRLSPGQVAHFIQGEDFDDELRGIFLRVLEICGESRDWDRICVLGRTHMDLFKVASYLKSKGVPTHVHSPQGFGSRREIQDALSIYKFLINSHDDLNLLQALRAPWLKVSDKLLVEWMNTKTSSLWNFLVELPNPPTPVQVLSKCKDGLKDWGLIKSFTDLLKEIHFIEKSSSFDPSGRVEANVWKFIAKLKDLERQPGSHPLEIMNSLNEESDAIAATEPNCVNLMTIHGSKGLEFDHVIFPRLG